MDNFRTLSDDTLAEILQQLSFPDIQHMCQTSRQLANFCRSARGIAIINELRFLYQVDKMTKTLKQKGITLEDILYQSDLIEEYKDVQKGILNKLLQHHPKIVDLVIDDLKQELIRRSYIIPFNRHLQTESRFNEQVNFIINSIIGLQREFFADEIFGLIKNIDPNITQELDDLYYTANKQFLHQYLHLLSIYDKYLT